MRVAFTAHEISIARMPQLEDAEAAASESIRSFEDRFQAGDAELLDRLAAEDAAFQATAGVISGRFAVLLSHYQIMGAMGHLRGSL